MLFKDIIFYHSHLFLTKKRRRLLFGFDKIEVKNKPNESREKGARVIAETIIAKVEIANSDIYIYTPEFMFDVNKEKQFNKKLKSNSFMSQLKLNVSNNKDNIYEKKKVIV